MAVCAFVDVNRLIIQFAGSLYDRRQNYLVNLFLRVLHNFIRHLPPRPPRTGSTLRSSCSSGNTSRVLPGTQDRFASGTAVVLDTVSRHTSPALLPPVFFEPTEA